MRRGSIFVTVLCLVLSACAAHSPFIMKDTTDSAVASPNKYPANHDKVFVTEQSLPAGVDYDVIGTIEVGKVWYGSSDNVVTSMADRARELGANAVIQVKTWHQPSGFSWAAPHGSGEAVRIKDTGSLTSLRVAGDWH
jgi:hypothetical protein